MSHLNKLELHNLWNITLVGTLERHKILSLLKLRCISKLEVKFELLLLIFGIKTMILVGLKLEIALVGAS